MATKLSDDLDCALIDLYDRLAALNPAYLRPASPYECRVNLISYAEATGRLYLVIGGAWLFSSRDRLESLEEVREINYRGDRLVAPEGQSIDALVETMDGTVVVVGQAGSGPSPEGLVWRRLRGAESFVPVASGVPRWRSSRNGNLAAGLFGPELAPMVALAIYDVREPHFYYSLDDGLTWRRQEMADWFVEHVHEVYLPRAGHPGRPARLWVTGGDDPSGRKSGVVTFDRLEAESSLGGGRFALRERPGFRLVGLAGNGKHVFIGNESVAGGVLKIQDNLESLEAMDFEYVLGKTRHDYHQFRALVATYDGLLVAGTDSYGHTGDSVRADSGGVLYVSADLGASFVEIPFGARWFSSLADDGEFFWAAPSGTRETGPDPSRWRTSVVRVRRPSRHRPPVSRYCAKTVVVDSSEFYRMAGYEAHPVAALAAGEATFRVDMSPWREVSLRALPVNGGKISVEGLPYSTWKLSEDPWQEVAAVSLKAGKPCSVVLPAEAAQNRYFRARNAGAEPLTLRYLAFVGKR
jgi:hypothetical protein